jgi:thioredoxin 1
MLVRLGIIVALVIVGFALFQLYRWLNLRQVGQQSTHDPLLSGVTKGIPIIVYFTTPQCMPCKVQQRPALRQLQVELGNKVQVVEVDATQDQEAATRWQVQSVPTTFILDATLTPREVNYGVADIHTLRRQLGAI